MVHPGQSIRGEISGGQAGVISESTLPDDLPGPLDMGSNRKRRRPVPQQLHSIQSLQELHGTQNIGTELFRRQRVNATVTPAVHADFVPLAGNLGDPLGVLFRDPAEDEFRIYPNRKTKYSS